MEIEFFEMEDMEPMTRERELQWRALQEKLALKGNEGAKQRLINEYGLKACWDPDKKELVYFTDRA